MYIKMNEDKSLIVTVPTTIYRGEQNADIITFLVPSEYEGLNVADCAAVLRYVLPSGLGRSESLSYLPEMYKSYLQFGTMANTRLTEERGTITIWLTFFNNADDVVLKTGEVDISVQQSKDINTYLPPDGLDQIDQLAAKVAELEAQKADNITFNKVTGIIQLTANGEPIGNQVFIDIDSANSVVEIEMNENNELIVTFEDGSTKNLGHVASGDGGVVYVPHMSNRKVLSWTIEPQTGEVPDPVDLNPFDEWHPMDDTTVETEYIWEPM